MCSAKLTGKELKAAFAAKLAESGLTETDAKKLGFLLCERSASTAPKDLPLTGAGFVLPYFTLSGKQTKFWRYRFLEDTRTGFKAATNAKPTRYVQPPKSAPELYLPPLANWKKIAEDSKVPLIITEGELKAACATKLGFPTIALGGVWSFRAASRGVAFLAGFDEFDLSDRSVYIVFDSDVSSNSSVIAAENALARKLLGAGAVPLVCRLPSLEETKKTGLDDFLVSEGKDALHGVLDAASVFSAAEELHRLNEEVVYVANPGVVLKLDTMQRLAPRAFVDHAYSPRIYYETVETANGTKLVEKSAAREWLKWGMRSWVERVAYAPGEPRLTEGGDLNVWPGWGIEPEPGNVKPWKELLDYLFRDAKPEARRWFEQWLAYPLQRPGTKLYSAVVMWGLIHGTGKSLVGYTMFRIYGANATEISNQDLGSTFNEWAENKQFVMGDEIAGGDKRNIADRMKSMITQKQLRLNPKHIPSYTVTDCINYYFTSNHPDAFFLEDSDRRFFIHEVKGAPLAGEFYRAYMKWLDNGGAEALFAYLLTLDVSDFEPHGHAPTTASKEEMIESGRSDIGTWVATLRTSPETILKMGETSLAHRKLWTTSELHSLYDPEGRSRVTANGLSRELRRAGFTRVYNGGPVLTHSGPQKLWTLTPDAVAGLIGPELGQLFDKERGHANGVHRTKRKETKR